MEKAPQATAGRTEERRKGTFYHFGISMFFPLKIELAGVFCHTCFASGKVHLFHQYNDMNKMKAAVKMIKSSLKSCFFYLNIHFSLVLVTQTETEKRLTQVLGFLVIYLFYLQCYGDVSVPG